MRVHEFASGCSVKTPLVSELLVFWDAPNRLGGYGSEKSGSSRDFAPMPGSCPSIFTFKAVLPTHYTESDGELTPLPPSFSDTLPGFHCDIRYEFCVYLTRVHDMRVKPMSVHAKWKRRTVTKHSFIYRPRSRPSRQAPFPPSSKVSSKGPITRFCSNVQPSSPFADSLRTLVSVNFGRTLEMSAAIPYQWIKRSRSEYLCLSSSSSSSTFPTPKSRPSVPPSHSSSNSTAQNGPSPRSIARDSHHSFLEPSQTVSGPFVGPSSTTSATA